MSKLHHEVIDGDEPTVVLLHEGAGSGMVWDRTRDSIRGGRRALVYDRRGFGRSPRDASFGADHFEQAVEDLRSLVRRSCDGPVVLVGHSDGGSIALLATIRHPELTRSVCVVDTHVYADAGTVEGLKALGPVQGWDERVRSLYARQHGDDWAEVVSSWRQMWTTGGLVGWDIRAELPAIRCPLLVVHDRADELSSTVHAEAIAAAARSAEVSWYDTGSHRPHLAERDRFCRELHAFWAG
jgi:pimeloyl-ACP methyl ester carboxylesterase